MIDDSRSRNNGTKTRKPIPPVEHQFKPGNPGRPKGSRNKLGEAFMDDLYQSWLAHGPAAIEAVLKTKPDAYLKVIASLLPKDLVLKVRPLDELSDEQLLERLRSLTKRAAPLLAKLVSDDESRTECADPRHSAITERRSRCS
jgi:hypothetical protein